MPTPSTTQHDGAGEDVFTHIIRSQRALWAPVEIAGLLNVSRHTVYLLIDDGELECHRLGTKPADDEAARRSIRITRRSIIAYLLRSANYKPKDEAQILALIASLLGDLSDLGLKHAQYAATDLLQKREHARQTRAAKATGQPGLL